jgi:RNA polymerase sigma-70 factor (family 1)
MKIVYSDMELIRGLQHGHEAAVKQLYEQHYQALCYYADKMISNKEEAEDIAVEVFLKLLRKKDDFDNLKDIESFLFTATKNACIDLIRKTKRRDADHNSLAFLTDSVETGNDREMIIAMTLQTIYAEVEKMPPQRKLVFQRIFFDGKTTAQIAGELGISPQTVLNHKNQAIEILRLKLYQQGISSAGVLMYCLFLLGQSSEL